MTLYKKIKESLNMVEVANYYGFKINHSCFISCIFHNERTPSMRLYKNNFHCFGCCAHGDIIDFVGKVFSLDPYDAAQKLASDFGILNDYNYISSKATSKIKRVNTEQKIVRSTEQEQQTYQLLLEYRHYLQYFKQKFAPKNAKEDIHHFFIERINQLDLIEMYLDILLFEPKEQRIEFMNNYWKELDRIEQQLYEYKRCYPLGRT